MFTSSLQRIRCHASPVPVVTGSAWGNAFFAEARAPDVHFIELNSLHGRASFVKMHHYIGGPSRYWVLPPELGPRARHMSLKRRYEARVRVPIGPLIVALHHAGVAHCPPPPRTDVEADSSLSEVGGPPGDAEAAASPCDMTNESVYGSRAGAAGTRGAETSQ